MDIPKNTATNANALTSNYRTPSPPRARACSVLEMEESKVAPGSIPRVLTTDTTEMPNARHTIMRTHVHGGETKRPQTSPIKLGRGGK